MYPTLLTVALFFTFAIQAIVADFTVPTPAKIVACKGQNLEVSWTGTNAGPYNLVIVSAEDPCGDALIEGGNFNKPSASVKVDELKAGQSVQIYVEDNNGDEGWSGVIPVKGCPASNSTSATADASSSASPTTLVVSNTPGAYGYGASAPATPSQSVAAVGGVANAQNNPFNAAVPRHISFPAVVLSTFAGALIFLL